MTSPTPYDASGSQPVGPGQSPAYPGTGASPAGGGSASTTGSAAVAGSAEAVGGISPAWPAGGNQGQAGGYPPYPQGTQAPGAPGGGYQQAGYYAPGAQQPGGAYQQAGYQQPGPYGPQYAPSPQGKSKVVAGVLGILLGALGVHNFYLGYTSKAVAQLGLTIGGFILTIIFIGPLLVFAAGIWGLIEGILILMATPGARPWGVDANGVPLSS